MFLKAAVPTVMIVNVIFILERLVNFLCSDTVTFMMGFIIFLAVLSFLGWLWYFWFSRELLKQSKLAYKLITWLPQDIERVENAEDGPTEFEVTEDDLPPAYDDLEDIVFNEYDEDEADPPSYKLACENEKAKQKI